MITIISGTNRKESNTLKIAQEYQHILTMEHVDSQILSLQNLSKNLLSDMMYEAFCPEFEAVQDQYFFHVNKFIFISPEYNGSIPGVLKIVLDASNIKKAFYHKKALLVGIATGRAGNLRGLDHLSAILNNMKVNVHWNKLPISKITSELSINGKFLNDATIKAVHNQIQEFIKF